MISTLLLAGFIVGFGFAQIPGLSFGNGAASSIQKNAAPEKADVKVAEQEPEEPKVVLTEAQIAALPDDDTVFGSADAPVTVVEFSDFQCPYCSRFFKSTFGQIEENYIKTGKVKFIYRDFPLDGHPQAQLAAEASECADDQGKFREMHDVLFEEQIQWSGNPEAEKVMKDFAKKLKLDAKKFGECLSTKKFAAEVRKDLVDGASAGITGTPGFFVNGKHISGAMPYNIFQALLDAELQGKAWEIQFDPLGKPSVQVL